MADVITDINELRAAAEASGRASADAVRRLAAAEGKRDTVAGDLEEQFGVGTVEDARALAVRAEAGLKRKVSQVRELMAQSGGQK